MTPAILLFAGLSLALLVLAIWLLAKPLPAEVSLRPSGNLEIEPLLPHHSRHFPQMRRILDAADEEFLARRVSHASLKSWRTERRRVLRRFLAGLGEDYAHLDYLARSVAALSPQVHRKAELERIWLGLRFRALYRMVSLRLAAEGSAPVKQLERLTVMLATLSSRLEAGMAGLETASAPPTVRGSLNP
jgi:hypothetical protein